MKALVKKNAVPGVWMEDVPVPEIGTNDVLIRVTHTAICGTDLHIYLWDEWARRTIKTPMVIGHEFSGVVEKVSPGVTHFKPGDRVSGEGHITCGNCRNCRAGKRHLCPHTIGVGINRNGSFAEYVAIPESNVWLLHDDIPSEIAAFFDPFGNAVHTALSFNVVGEDVLITGAGPIGIMAAAICKFSGARNIVITDVVDYRLDLALKLGATLAINVKKDSVQDCFGELGISSGFDVGLEMSGNPDAFKTMLETMYNGGSIALLGLLPESTRINWDEIIFKGLHLKGIYGRQMYETWYKMTQLLRGGLDLSPVLTHKLPAAHFLDGFKVMESGHCGKVVLEW